jgi:hypothetical protein
LAERDRLAATKLQSHVRSWLERARLRRDIANVVLIQSHFRRCVAVNSLTREQAVVCKRLKRINNNTEEGHSLQNRTLDALANLLTTTDGGSFNMAQVLNCCDTMLVASNWSSVCCKHIVHQGAVPVIFGLIDSLNRSLPHLKLLALALKVINNIVRFAVDDNKVFQQPQYIATLFSLMKIHLEKPEVFTIVCDILFNICSNKVTGRLFVRVIAQNKKLVDRYLQMYEELKRKVRIEKDYLQKKATERDLMMIENGMHDAPKTVVNVAECKTYSSYKSMQRVKLLIAPQ